VPQKTFFGLDLTSQRDILLLVVEEHLSRSILESIARAGRFDSEPGSGIAFQIPIEFANDPVLQDEVKIGILGGSLLAGLAASCCASHRGRFPPRHPAGGRLRNGCRPAGQASPGLRVSSA
jgi:hypothetical protein